MPDDNEDALRPHGEQSRSRPSSPASFSETDARAQRSSQAPAAGQLSSEQQQQQHRPLESPEPEPEPEPEEDGSRAPSVAPPNSRTTDATRPYYKRQRGMEERLQQMPEKRPLPWRPGVEPGAEVETGGESRRKQIRFGCLLATRGDVAPQPCLSCLNGRGKFSLCVFLEGYFRGACASCQLSGRPNRCSIKQGDDGDAKASAENPDDESPNGPPKTPSRMIQLPDEHSSKRRRKTDSSDRERDAQIQWKHEPENPQAHQQLQQLQPQKQLQPIHQMPPAPPPPQPQQPLAQAQRSWTSVNAPTHPQTLPPIGSGGPLQRALPQPQQQQQSQPPRASPPQLYPQYQQNPNPHSHPPNANPPQYLPQIQPNPPPPNPSQPAPPGQSPQLGQYSNPPPRINHLPPPPPLKPSSWAAVNKPQTQTPPLPPMSAPDLQGKGYMPQREQVHHLVSGMQIGIEHLQRELDSLKRALGIEGEE